jgi:hypothetical protein
MGVKPKVRDHLGDQDVDGEDDIRTEVTRIWCKNSTVTE